MNGTLRPDARAILFNAIAIEPAPARDLVPLVYPPGEVPASAVGCVQALLLDMRRRNPRILLRAGVYSVERAA